MSKTINFPKALGEYKPYPDEFDMSTLVGRVFKVVKTAPHDAPFPEVHLCTGYISGLLVIGGKGFTKGLVEQQLQIRETKFDNEHNRTFVWVPTGVRG